MATPGQIQTVTKHFLICAVWADSQEGTAPKVPNSTRAAAFDLCKTWIDRNLELFNEAMERAAVGYGSHPDAGSAEAALGHDLWLTARGHGVGFWDRDELNNLDPDDVGESLGDRLTTAARTLEGVELDQYKGWVYLYGTIKGAHNG